MVRPPPPLTASRPALAVSRPALAASAALAAAAGAAACAPRHSRDPAAAATPGGSTVTLYRDAAVVQQRIELDVPASGVAVARVRVPAGLGAGDVLVLPQAGVEVTALRQPGAVKTAPSPALSSPKPRPSDDLLGDELAPAEPAAEPPPPSDRPIELELTARARPGRVTLRLGYVTDRLGWDAAYTLTASPAHDRALLRGAVAIRNTGGVALPRAAVRLVDASISDARTRSAAALTARLGLTTARAVAAPAEAPPPRELGRVDLPEGETRVELVRPAPPRPMRAVLVYDPIGTRFDHTGRDPATDADLGVRPPAGPRVDESFEIDRDPAITGGLPAGPVRLLERRPDGALALLGESRLFDAAARVAQRDTITIGAAGGVTGGRERRELTVDEERKRVVEEFVITIDNQRPRPVEVVLREHLYRGTNWTLAYVSTPVGDETKEGPQQVAPRIAVPARGKARLAYTVVYWW
jgi:hypothetical protein